MKVNSGLSYDDENIRELTVELIKPAGTDRIDGR